MNNKPIALIEGLGFTGSGAVLDLLREVDDFFVLPTEFRLVSDPDGILNLESALVDNWTVFQGDMAIKRFYCLCQNLSSKYRNPYSVLDHNSIFGKEFLPTTEKYLHRLTNISFRGLWYGIDTTIQRKLNRVNFLNRSKLLTKQMFIAKDLTVNEFISYTNAYLLELIELCKKKYNKERFAVDGDYSALNPEKILRYFPNSKMLLVIRDPRDVYATVRTGSFLFAPKDFEQSLDWQLAIYKRWKEATKDLSDDVFRVIKFEDLIINYDDTVEKIFDYYNIDSYLHKNKNQYLFPEQSKKNVGLWKKYLTKTEADIIKEKFKKLYDFKL